MTYEQIRQKMVEYYENEDWVDTWMNSVNPHIVFQNRSPKDIFNLQNHAGAVRFGEDFAKWIDTQKTL